VRGRGGKEGGLCCFDLLRRPEGLEQALARCKGEGTWAQAEGCVCKGQRALQHGCWSLEARVTNLGKEGGGGRSEGTRLGNMASGHSRISVRTLQSLQQVEQECGDICELGVSSWLLYHPVRVCISIPPLLHMGTLTLQPDWP
jgi:hypothetical protein